MTTIIIIIILSIGLIFLAIKLKETERKAVKLIRIIETKLVNNLNNLQDDIHKSFNETIKQINNEHNAIFKFLDARLETKKEVMTNFMGKDYIKETISVVKKVANKKK